MLLAWRALSKRFFAGLMAGGGLKDCSPVGKQSTKHSGEQWSSNVAAILAVAGSAVGLGNFLRFPGMAAEHGGGAFMIAYVISFIIIGLPISWAEWAAGRYGGSKGFHSSPGVMNLLWKSPLAKYVGVLGVIVPVCIYMYYIYIEAWCLGYAVNFIFTDMRFESIDASTDWWANFIGMKADGSVFHNMGIGNILPYLLFVFVLNFYVIYRGVSKGIEKFSNYAMPVLLLLGFIVLIRVLTLGTPDPAKPENNINNGLGFLWNPQKTYLVQTDAATGKQISRSEIVGAAPIAAAEAEMAAEKAAAAAGEAGSGVITTLEVTRIGQQLKNPNVWLAAAGQIFFSLSIGLGIIITYASYVGRREDVALSALTASSANQMCEVGLGGLITVPAAVAFLGVAGLAGAGLSTFDLGFRVLPMVLTQMPGGPFFGFLWFFLLFLSAILSSVSVLQPGIAFVEEALRIDRKRSVALLGMITITGTALVVYFSKDVKVLDTLDFWVGTFLAFTLGTLQTMIYAWAFGAERIVEEAHKGARIRIPRIFVYIIRYVTPVFLLAIFAVWLTNNFLGESASPYVIDLLGNAERKPSPVAWLAIGIVAALFAFFCLITSTVQRYKEAQKNL